MKYRIAYMDRETKAVSKLSDPILWEDVEPLYLEYFNGENLETHEIVIIPEA